MTTARTDGNRSVHLVGTVPADDAAAAFALFARSTGDHLPPWVPDGETGDRLDWIQRVIDGLRSHPDLRVAQDGDWSDYEKTPYFEVAPGAKFTTLELDYNEHFTESWPAFKDFSKAEGRSRLLQVGIPSQLDLALVAFGFKPVPALRNVSPFRDATVREITKIHAVGGNDVVFQIEIPIPLILLTRVPSPLRPVVARLLARELVKVVRRSPRGTKFGIHLCYGDMNNESMADPSNSAPLVILANAIVRAWPAAQRLAFVHAPFARGKEPPGLEPSFYESLKDLELPSGVRFAAGFVHEALSLEQLQSIRDIIETNIGTTVDVGAACGLGRRDPERALKNLELSRAVAE